MLTLASLGWYLVEQGIPQGNPEALLVWSTFDSEHQFASISFRHDCRVICCRGHSMGSNRAKKW
ncbi:hypothetical protein MtrunA17_Chr8g0374441 [Medicago truncatula]|uniref:Uncharacterized protein n=1 Tax=Medicago truncatula TaxID=3880 RepID=A0A396GNY5_MEDTR|nr:hypothetical protein MtrunA17_Chr8g0374441 [Medicago truncatula]